VRNLVIFVVNDYGNVRVNKFVRSKALGLQPLEKCY